MAQQEGKPQKRMPGTRRPQLPPSVLFWWLLSLAVLIWYVVGLWPPSQPKARIPYSLFLTHGQALGMTEQIPGEDRYNLSLSYLKARLAVMLGGRTAEEIVFGEVTTGAENDLVEAMRLARRMVTRWG